MEEIWIQAKSRRISLLVEADGARRLPLKAPANHEPVVPSWIHSVIVVAGLLGLGKPVTADWVHRLERFAALSGSAAGELVTVEALARLLKHPEGGLKGIPAGARRIALLNQADTEELKAAGQRLAGLLLPDFERVLIASLGLAVDEAGRSKPGPDFEQVSAVHKPVAGVLLAGGGSQRLGRPKQLLPWRGEPLVRHSARAALEAGLEPLVVVTGASREAVEAALIGLPVILAYNEDWNQGQSTSVRAGVQALPATTGAVVFLLSDQPQVPPALIRALIAAHRETLSKIIAPEVAGRRANPVLFDRSTFADLLLLSGDTGGRGIFSRYSPMHIPWYDDSLLLDVDTEEDYLKLLALQ
jgi:molybdenum cofactor cytidylyltransferase